jgi:hypothetical protein
VLDLLKEKEIEEGAKDLVIKIFNDSQIKLEVKEVLK